MRISTKGRYGLRALFDLAVHQGSKGNRPVSLREISERQRISEAYLEQLFAPLRHHGLVRSVRGAQGGYVLAQPASQITVADIIRALEGPVAPVDCVREDEGEICNYAENCVAHLVWLRLRDSINRTLESITLEDMCSYYRGQSSELS